MRQIIFKTKEMQKRPLTFSDWLPHYDVLLTLWDSWKSALTKVARNLLHILCSFIAKSTTLWIRLPLRFSDAAVLSFFKFRIKKLYISLLFRPPQCTSNDLGVGQNLKKMSAYVGRSLIRTTWKPTLLFQRISFICFLPIIRKTQYLKFSFFVMF